MIRTMKQELLAASISFDEELDRLLRLLAVQRVVERQIRQSAGSAQRGQTAMAPVLKRGETAEAQAVLAAQLRFNRAGRRT